MRVAIAGVVGGLIAMAFGALWYGLFSSPWQAAAGVVQADVESMGAWMYLLPLGGWVLAAFALNGLFSILKNQSWSLMLRATFYAWLAGALIATILYTIFGQNGLDLLWIDGLHMLCALIIITVISKLIAWRA